ncbi:MAG: response regulator [Ginsengibacter sp.]
MNQDLHVLLIEDNDGDVELIKEAFSNSKLKRNLVVCSNGEHGLNYMKEREHAGSEQLPTLILLDINLPKIDGKELLAFLKQHERFKRIPVIMLTSSSLPKDILYAYENHANSYIVKPSNLHDFTEAIRCIENFWINFVTYPKTQ